MSKKCPFMKNTLYMCGRNMGTGYPEDWKAIETFCNCMEDKCMMWDTSDDFRKITGKDGWCKMAK